MNSITIKDAEITVVGCTFIVDYRYHPAIPATNTTPEDSAEVEILRVEIKGQPEGDADELLFAIKTNLTGSFTDKFGIRYNDGFDIIQQFIIKRPPL